MILQVIPSDHRRGSEVFGVTLGHALQQRGFSVSTVALAPGELAHPLAVPSLGTSRRNPATIRALRRRLGSADLVVAHGSTTLAVTAMASVGRGVPFVYRSVGDPSYWSDSFARRLRVAAYLGRAATVVTLWPAAAEFVIGRLHVARERVAVIPNAVQGSHFRPAGDAERAERRRAFGLPAAARVVVSVGSLTSEKDPATTVRAVARMPDVWLLVIGDGPLRPSLATLADAIAPGRVVFAGVMEDPRAAYAAADVVVSSSLTEGMPAVLIEAALCGVPAVATDVGGVSQIVVDGATGRLVTAGDPEQLAVALGEVLESPSGCGQAARAHCSARFELDAVANEWEALLRRLGSAPV